MSAHLRVAVLVVLTLSGCIGRPVVDFQPQGEEFVCPNVAVRCDDERMSPVIDPITDVAFTPAWVDCAPPPFASLEMPSDRASCANLVAELPAGDPIVIEEAVWRDARIVLRASAPATLRLDAAILERVQITLEGQAWLEIGPGSSTTDVVLDVDPAMEGRAITLTEGDHHHLAVRTGPRAEVRFERADVSGGVIDVGSLLADEAELLGVSVRARDVVLAATNITEGRLEVGRAAFIDAKLEHVDVAECESIRFRGSVVSHSHLAACDQTTVIWGSTMTRVRLEGAASIAETAVMESALAPGPGHGIAFIGASVTTSVFCEAERVTGAGTTFLCVECVPDIPSVELLMSSAEAPQCPAIQIAADL